MKRRNILIALVFIICISLIVPSIVTRVKYENSHKGFALGLVYKESISLNELTKYKEGGIDTLIFDENQDYETIKRCKDLGFSAVLRISAGDKKADDFEEKLDKKVKDFTVKYLIVTQSKNSNLTPAPIENVIKNNSMTLVLKESKNQVSNETPIGYDTYLESADGRVLRAYETLKNPLRTLNTDDENAHSGKLLLSHMVNSARDRNTEFIILNRIENSKVTRDENIENTIFASQEFQKWMSENGYRKNAEISLSGYETNIKLVTSSSLMCAFIMLLAVIIITLGKRCAKLEYAFLIASPFLFMAGFFIPENLLWAIPTLFATASASFGFLISIYISEKLRNKFSFSVSVVLSLLSAFCVLITGALFMTALLSGKDYYLNNSLFRGVKLSLMLPVLFSLPVMFIRSGFGRDLKDKGVKGIIKLIRPYHIVFALIAVLAGFIYLSRSGNAKISPIENEIRNYMALLTGARPRTKEFLIGWPVFSLLVYHLKKGSPKIIKFIFGVGSSILFASVTNTFCHVFTDFEISFMRTLYGLLFSLPIIAIALTVNKLIIKSVKK